MSGNEQTIATNDAHVTGNYGRFPIAIARGEGCRVFDEDGKAYLDLLSGLGVSALGHSHPGLVAAIREQAGELLHVSNLYYQKNGAWLAERLTSLTFADRVFFCNSGAEANEAAIKMARRRDPDRNEIVALHGSFHGRTLGALAATGQPALQEGFGPMVPGFVHVELGDIDAVAAAVGDQTAAVMVEPILGEGGVVPLPVEYLQALRSLCDQSGALLVLDEVQTGNGRTGKLYAHEHYGITPDVMTTAKGLAGGLPIGAVLATEATAATFVPGTHGSTFGANPLACRAALAVLEALVEGGVIENARKVGEHLQASLRALAERRDDIVEVRGMGLMVGVEFRHPTKEIVTRLLERGVLANATAGSVLRLLPPLVVTTEEIDEGIAQLESVLA